VTGLNTIENSEVPAQTPPFEMQRLSWDCTIFYGAFSGLWWWKS